MFIAYSEPENGISDLRILINLEPKKNLGYEHMLWNGTKLSLVLNDVDYKALYRLLSKNNGSNILKDKKLYGKIIALRKSADETSGYTHLLTITESIFQ